MKVYTKKVERQRRLKIEIENKMNQLKVCVKCRQIKPMSAFGIDKTHKNGLQSWCRACKAAWARQYYQSKKQLKYCPHCGGII